MDTYVLILLIGPVALCGFLAARQGDSKGDDPWMAIIGGLVVAVCYIFMISTWLAFATSYGS